MFWKMHRGVVLGGLKVNTDRPYVEMMGDFKIGLDKSNILEYLNINKPNGTYFLYSKHFMFRETPGAIY